MFQTILVPVDGSPYAERTLERATSMARDEGARLVILTVALDLGHPDTPHVPKLDEATIHRLEEYANGLAERARQEGVESTVVVRRGLPAPSIVGVARELSVDLIVMASHGQGAAGAGFPSYGLGGVTFKVLHDAPCPVLVLRVSRDAGIVWGAASLTA